MRRRDLLVLAGGMPIAQPLAARAQRRESARVGWLTVALNPQVESFRAGMQALGYNEGVNLTIEHRDAGGDAGRLADLAAALVRLKPDVVVAVGAAAAIAMRQLASGVPVVFVSNDPVRWGLVDSLARPGGDFTGMELMSVDISVKWLELIVEMLPGATRIAALRATTSNIGQTEPLGNAGVSIGRQVTVIEVRDANGYGPAFDEATRWQAQGLIVLSTALFHAHRRTIVELAAKHRLPAIYEHRDFADVGGLISYGPDVGAVFARLANYVDRILKGTKPAELPVERPIKFQLVVNRKTAKALGLNIPPAILARADEVIE